MKRKKTVLTAFVAVLLVLTWLSWANTALVTTHITYADARIAQSFDGFRIVHISDTHDARIGKDNERLIHAVSNAGPDLIAITGDFVDSNRVDIDASIELAGKLAKIAPAMYINGNHEAVIPEEDYERLAQGIKDAGIMVLDDSMIPVSRENVSVSVIGINDIGFLDGMPIPDRISGMQEKLSALTARSETFNIVLSHRPELIDAYAAAKADLVLSGHAHGGQARIPFVGGVIAPGQGLFPEYDAGLYHYGETDMIVSRGIGNSVIPLRVNNRPEIVVIELKYMEK